jgi:hypothetical protein
MGRFVGREEDLKGRSCLWAVALASVLGLGVPVVRARDLTLVRVMRIDGTCA